MSDAATRRAALDPRRSFLVQAPAGSGKTELLIQRYLTLLANVQAPEQVVAITFTRKAAAEMRARVFEALASARVGSQPSKPHAMQTFDLAAAVLTRDAELGWELWDHPQRLKIDTLDALNSALAQHQPLLSGGVTGAAIAENAARYYREAAGRVLSALDSDGGELGAAVRSLVRARHNDLGSLQRLLADLLPRRDQWLRHLTGSSDDVLRARLERALEHLCEEVMQDVMARLEPAQRLTLAALMQHAAHCAHPKEQRELSGWLEQADLPEPRATELGRWRAAARLLLTEQGAWRRRAPAQFGFGAEHPDWRDRWHELAAQLGPHSDVHEAFQRVAHLPPPRYQAAQWSVLSALRVVLLHLAAELRLVFSANGVVDFVELALAAQQALGRSDEPSELLLALDRRIEHILVDEFQDTSHSQLKLLELLTAGWEQGDGRTLFLVGDAMQSIYRFRDADMSLFLAVSRNGIGDVRCEHLRLQQNFRSAPALLEWFNGAFPRIFPEHDDLEAGASRYAPSQAVRAAAAQQGVVVHALRAAAADAEVRRVVEILEQEMIRAPEQSIAVLVRSRSHLQGLRGLLRGRGWPVHAVEIESLETHQLGQDLLGLTRALSHLGDRAAWLGMLRAPWCGLRWCDLEALCRGTQQRSVWDLMHDERRLVRLSADGRNRLVGLRSALHVIFARRAEITFALWVEDAWHLIGGPSCLQSSEDLMLAERFFTSLEQLEVRDDLDDPAALELALADLAAADDEPREAGIEIMTIHRAKGLEFDTVVLLGLGREPRPEGDRALHWSERVTHDGGRELLLAPLGDPGEKRDPLSAYLKHIERLRDAAERARLLYVAMTRARERLHLVARLTPEVDRPRPRSLLAYLWPLLEPDFRAALPDAEPAASAGGDWAEPVLRRLSRICVQPTSEPPPAWRKASGALLRPRFEWARPAAAAIGTIVHRELQRLADLPDPRSAIATIRDRAEVYQRELALLGVEPGALADGAERVVTALCNTLEDQHGLWILGHHAESRSELALTEATETGFAVVKLDRTFVDSEGMRWIIDFKASVHEGGDLESFVNTEIERYRPQLERYARIMQMIDARPIRLGLYFPLLQVFRSWAAGEPFRDCQAG